MFTRQDDEDIVPKLVATLKSLYHSQNECLLRICIQILFKGDSPLISGQ